jgi:hypothetical protein
MGRTWPAPERGTRQVRQGPASLGLAAGRCPRAGGCPNLGPVLFADWPPLARRPAGRSPENDSWAVAYFLAWESCASYIDTGSRRCNDRLGFFVCPVHIQLDTDPLSRQTGSGSGSD